MYKFDDRCCLGETRNSIMVKIFLNQMKMCIYLYCLIFLFFFTISLSSQLGKPYSLYFPQSKLATFGKINVSFVCEKV